MPNVIGGTSNGSTISSITSRLPGNSRRASAYAAGTPSRPDNATTANTTWNVTIRMSSSWNSFHAARYQRVVQPAGNHVPSQRVANELVTTVAIMPNRLITKKPTNTQTAVRHSRAPIESSGGMALAFRAGRGAAIEQPAQADHRDHDGELYQRHDHRDRGGHRVVVLFERRLIGGNRNDARRSGRCAEQHGGR